MSEVDPDMFDDFEDLTTKAKRRERVRSGKRKKPGPTASGRVQHAAEIRAARDQRRKEALEKIQSRLLERHFSSETPEEENRLRRYVRWVEESLAQGFPFVKEEDIEFKGTIASVKAGGQHRQKKRTAVRATHLPTSFSAKNEEERSFEQNKNLARDTLYRNLDGHLKLWQTMVRSSGAPVDIGKTTLELLATDEEKSFHKGAYARR
ncbi:MAG: hypothetical protein A2900_02295 [Candidatus Chisholmbacteria bacterium RIFCSPLOWO2_01_FULL_50_28]|uniref:Prokaryotic-type class I peptide chain release factors domain-containing protein n=1 Tax=Candidatus Chisholmbacteria bacterium RIFCSPHIGHO2_01_FULL_52_32 TaxID=1797591 RepID=A0A1G1VTJ0_9BACT|nr:MAG: hypothetical protein A2786_04450 [Candidatus Chisholmbacteria bacterium RIFCSPHIGHO2_01_FULL_52_32]OGY19914.1 MAG: hypothetical protein A2900_02295 [Candidatus Chisholmbacteria bacterium RIFCSPLOWO2_01_FULL_50_28]